MVGFTGSRSLSQKYQPLVAQVVFAGRWHRLAVGCAAGADLFVRQSNPLVQVFRASSFAGPPAARLVKRSTAMVQAVAASSSPLLVGFASIPCPAGLFPSPVPSQCFAGFGSGTWATLALAVGLGVPVRVYLCGTQFLPVWGGSWSPVNRGHRGHRFNPGSVQQSLF